MKTWDTINQLSRLTGLLCFFSSTIHNQKIILIYATYDPQNRPFAPMEEEEEEEEEAFSNKYNVIHPLLILLHKKRERKKKKRPRLHVLAAV